jgi:hypothetical protein
LEAQGPGNRGAAAVHVAASVLAVSAAIGADRTGGHLVGIGAAADRASATAVEDLAVAIAVADVAAEIAAMRLGAVRIVVGIVVAETAAGTAAAETAVDDDRPCRALRAAA